MAYCVPMKLPDGGVAIVRMSGKRPKAKPCEGAADCKAESSRLCDWKIDKASGATCDKPLCAAHSFHPGKNKDLCPEHRVAYEQWQARKIRNP